VIFALRAIGVVLFARWLFSMSQMGYRASLSAMMSSPWAFVYLVLIFLLLVQPGAAARAERPFHPLPQWLRLPVRDLVDRRVRLGGRLAACAACGHRDQRLARRRARAVCGGRLDLPAASAVADQRGRAPLCDRPLCDFARYADAHRDRLDGKPQGRPVRRARAVGALAGAQHVGGR